MRRPGRRPHPHTGRRASAALLGALVLVLAACSGATDGRPDPADGTGDMLGGEVTVYAAASLSGVFDVMADAFMAEHPGVQVVPVYDGSSTLATQISGGAPADVFASADEATMRAVVDLVVAPEVFASNTLVIAVPADDPGRVRTLADLADVTTVLCAPEVPCGAASATLLHRAGVEVEAASLEQNVTAVLTKVATGEADAGLVYATDTASRADVTTIVPDGADEVVNRYPIAALADARSPDAATAFVAFVLSDAGQAILADAGFGAP